MAPPMRPPKNARNTNARRLLIAAALTGLLLSGAAIVAAQPQKDHRPAAIAADRPVLRAEERGHIDTRGIDAPKRLFVPIEIQIRGFATTQDNASYAFAATGEGLAKPLYRNGSLVGLVAYARLDVDLAAQNATSLSDDRPVVVRFVARAAPDGEWHWVMKGRSDAMVLRGNSTGIENGTLPFEGHGVALAKALGIDRPGRLSLDVHGTVQRA